MRSPLRSVLLLLALTTVAAAVEGPVPQGTCLEGEKGPYLMGPLDREDWAAFEPDLEEEMRAYAPSPDLVSALGRSGREVRVTCVLGTWCSDSRREVPRFWKLLDNVGASGPELVMIGVGRRDAPEAAAWEAEHGVTPGYRERYDIEFVPTFIVTEEGEEIGRIEETPEVSLEADLAAILGVRAVPAWH